MQHKFFRLHTLLFTGRGLWTEEAVAIIIAVVFLVSPSSAVIRLHERSLIMHDSSPGVTTSYTLSFGYTTPAAVGSVDILVCEDPIPYLPCDIPAGFDASQAVLSNQTGEADFSAQVMSSNHIILSRAPSVPSAPGLSTYTFSNIVNPTDMSRPFAIRLKSLASTDGTGPQIDVGSVRGQITNSIMFETQVPPQLIFCLAGEVSVYCTDTNNNYFTDMGELAPDVTLTAQSQMAVGTNATGGFSIVVNGTAPAAGTNVIDSPTVPTVNKRGTDQFGINLVANNEPGVGSDPEGVWANAIPTPGYSVPDQYMYIPGDEVAFSPDVSLMKKFTVSYILNSSPDIKPGVYTTTLTFTASGRF